MRTTKITKQTGCAILGDETVKVTTAGNIIAIMQAEHTGHDPGIRKLDKDSYVYTETGEVRQFAHGTARSDDLKTVARSIAQGRDIINANTKNPERCRWLTLTYAENMQDPERLYLDCKHFMERMHKKYGAFEYIMAAEPQERGAWHAHIITIHPNKAPYMANTDVSEAWKQGFVSVKACDNCDNLGAYLSAYLGNVELRDEDEAYYLPENIITAEIVEDGQKKSKRFVKGGRLNMYPVGMHIFRWSRGVKKPTVEHMTYSRAKEKVSAATLTYSKTTLLEDGDFSNVLRHEYYNMVRKKSQD